MAAPYYGQQPIPQPYPQPQPGYNPEASSIKSLVNIASIFGILISVVALLVSLYYLSVWATFRSYTYSYGYYSYSTSLDSIIIVMGVVFMVMFVFGLLFFFNCKKIGQMVDNGQYIQAKSKTMVWMIIGFLFAGVISGVLLLLAYTKFDNLIRGPQPQGYGGSAPYSYQQPQPQVIVVQTGNQQQPTYQQPPPPPMPEQLRTCMGCGRQIPMSHQICNNCGKKQ